jgi:hypothetical protein
MQSSAASLTMAGIGKTETHGFVSELKAWAFEESGAFDVPPLVSKDRVTPPDLLLMISHLVVNAETFWEPTPGLVLGEGET